MPKKPYKKRPPQAQGARPTTGSATQAQALVESIAAAGAAPDDALTAELASLPAENLTTALAQRARRDQDRALPWLVGLATQAPESVAAAAAAALGEVKTLAAAEALQDLGATTDRKVVRKAARTALYRLQATGIVVRQAEPSAPVSVAREVLLAKVSNPDGSGDRFLALAVAGPLGSADLVVAIAGDEGGLRHVAGLRLPRGEVPRRLAIWFQESEGLHLVDAPADYVRQVLLEAHERSRSTGQPVPEEYYRWAPVLGRPEQVWQREPVYDEINAALVRWSPQLVEESGELFHLPEFSGWLIPREAAEEALRNYGRLQGARIFLPGEETERQQFGVVERLAEAFFDESRRQLYQRRLEQAAFVLHRAGRVLDARRALAAAVALSAGPRASAARLPFAVEMALHTLQSLQSDSERERTRQGGLILPG